ncbi:MAG: hypothetical protein Q8P10_00845 [bacterium]|nr:hypothetical protein [bacterium]
MDKQQGQAIILIPIIILIASLFLFDYSKIGSNVALTPTPTPTPPLPCMVGGNPTPDTFLSLPAINNFSEGNGSDPTIGQDGGPNLSAPYKQYRLVRVKVPVDPIDSWSNGPLLPRSSGSSLHFIKYNNQNIEGINYEVYYPNQWGESTLDGQFQWKYNSDNHQDLRFHQEGFLFFLRLKPDGSPVTTPAIDRVSGAAKDFYLVDLYQEETRYQASLTGARGYTYTDVFKCQGGAVQTTQKAVYPSQADSGNKKQLQLQYFKIETVVTGNDYGFSAHCKPAIYLYPEKQTDVNVKVNTKGELLYTKPLYPQNGWDVTAYPNGKIVYKGDNFEYLYYESRIPDSLINKPKEGFVSSYQNLPKLFSDILPKLGLSGEQTSDFKEYWERVLPSSKYYFVGILSEDNINSFEPLDINPKPVTIIRVRLYFEALDKKTDVQQPNIITPKKDGFTVVEWGGMVKRDKDHPFTCSE